MLLITELSLRLQEATFCLSTTCEDGKGFEKQEENWQRRQACASLASENRTVHEVMATQLSIIISSVSLQWKKRKNPPGEAWSSARPGKAGALEPSTQSGVLSPGPLVHSEQTMIERMSWLHSSLFKRKESWHLRFLCLCKIRLHFIFLSWLAENDVCLSIHRKEDPHRLVPWSGDVGQL